MQRGFTLVEILAVVLIIGITTSLVVVQMGSRNDIATGAAARQLVSDLSYSQTLAVSRQMDVFVYFDTSSADRNYQVCSSVDPQPAPLLNPGTNAPYITSAPLIESALFDAHNVLVYDSSGQPWAWDQPLRQKTLFNYGGITLRNGASVLNISVEPFTGEVRVY